MDEFCPCNLYNHDHCQSVYLQPQPQPYDDTNKRPGIIVCFQCYQLLAGNTVIMVKPYEKQLFLYAAASGNLLASIDLKDLPPSFEQFRNVAKAAAQSINIGSDNSGICRLAADGYAYSKLQFIEYYGTRGEEMWDFAHFRTVNIRLVYVHEHKCASEGVMTREEYLGLLPQNIHYKVANYVSSSPFFQLYISPFLWPHEPVRLHGEMFEDWFQCRIVPCTCRSDKKRLEEMTMAYRTTLACADGAADNMFYTFMAHGQRVVALTNCF